MKISDLLEEVQEEIERDKRDLAKVRLKSRLLEVQAAKKCLSKMEKQLEDLLGKEIDDVV